MRKYLLFILMVFLSSTHLLLSKDTLEESYKRSAIQRKELSKKYGISEEQAGFVQKFSFIRTKKIDSLVKLNLPRKQFLIERENVTDEYYDNIYQILTEEQRRDFNPEVFKAARTGEIKVLRLPTKEALAMGKIKADYLKLLKALSDGNLPKTEKRLLKEKYDREYQEKLKNFLSAENFKKWKHYKNTADIRLFRNKFGFSKEQYKQYIEIQNKKAIEIYKINNSTISLEERAEKTKEVERKEIEQLKSILSSKAFMKWFNYYKRK